MVHYGWACAASWQMLRHASVWEPAGRGRGRRDAVATRHRLTQAIPSCFSLRTTKRTRLLQYDIHKAFWKAVRPPEHPRLRGERLGFCAPLLRQSIAINLQPTLLFPMRQT